MKQKHGLIVFSLIQRNFIESFSWSVTGLVHKINSFMNGNKSLWFQRSVSDSVAIFSTKYINIFFLNNKIRSESSETVKVHEEAKTCNLIHWICIYAW